MLFVYLKNLSIICKNISLLLHLEFDKIGRIANLILLFTR